MTNAPEGNSFHDMRARLEALQAPLAQLVDLGQYVYRSIRPTAPHITDTEPSDPVWYTASMNTHNGLPISDTLTLGFGENEHITIERYNGENKLQPVWRIDHHVTYDETRIQRTRVKVFGEASGAIFPYDIDTSLYAGNIHDSFLGYGYVDQEPHMEKLEDQLLSLVLPTTQV
jgi:hypothetical protein